MHILITNPIDPATIEFLSRQHHVTCAFGKTHNELRELIVDSEVLIFRSGVNIDANLLDCAPGLRFLIRAGSGLDNVDLDYLNQRGLKLVRIPGPSAQAVAEMSFALMLALSRRLLEADQSMRRAQWAKYELAGDLLARKVLGIVGVGNIGTRVAELGVAWGMEVIGCVEFPNPERVTKMREKGILITDFKTVISQAEYLSIHVPLKDSTRKLIDAGVLSQMKPGSFLVNLARGGIVDEQALHKALLSGNTVKAAAVDVHEKEGKGILSPLADLSNVILTPHIGAMVPDTQRQIGQHIRELITSFIPVTEY